MSAIFNAFERVGREVQPIAIYSLLLDIFYFLCTCLCFTHKFYAWQYNRHLVGRRAYICVCVLCVLCDGVCISMCVSDASGG